jgi:hypothetical protein
MSDSPPHVAPLSCCATWEGWPPCARGGGRARPWTAGELKPPCRSYGRPSAPWLGSTGLRAMAASAELRPRAMAACVELHCRRPRRPPLRPALRARRRCRLACRTPPPVWRQHCPTFFHFEKCWWKWKMKKMNKSTVAQTEARGPCSISGEDDHQFGPKRKTGVHYFFLIS